MPRTLVVRFSSWVVSVGRLRVDVSSRERSERGSAAGPCVGSRLLMSLVFPCSDVIVSLFRIGM